MCLSSFLLCAQTTLTINLQTPRAGDALYKQQVNYKDPGRRGENVVWDFSRLKATNEDYRVYYFKPSKELEDTTLVTCVEHRTMYGYALTGDSLFLLGFENTGSRLVYEKPELCLTYPFRYGDSITDTYKGAGRYKNTLLTEAEGTLTTVADATGTLVLPDGDTIANVLRVRSERCYTQRLLPIDYELDYRLPKNDTIEIEDKEATQGTGTDSTAVAEGTVTSEGTNNDPGMKNGSNAGIRNQQGSLENNKKTRQITRRHMLLEKTDSVLFRTEACRWYAPGYRYPLFETIRNMAHLTRKDTAETADIATAFYFPPSRHTYLEEDPGNQAVLDSLLAAGTLAPSDTLLFDYNYYPNPVRSELNVELLLDLPSAVTFRLFDSSGTLVMTSQEGSFPAGVHYFTLNTSRLRFGEHLLHIVVNHQTAGAIILKF